MSNKTQARLALLGILVTAMVVGVSIALGSPEIIGYLIFGVLVIMIAVIVVSGLWVLTETAFPNLMRKK